MTLDVGRLVILNLCRQHRDWPTVLMFIMGTPLSALTPCFSPSKSHRKGNPEPMKLSKEPKQAKGKRITHAVADLPSMRFAPSCTRPFLGKAGKVKTGKKTKKGEGPTKQACSPVHGAVVTTPVDTPVDTIVPTPATTQGSISDSRSHSPNLTPSYEPTISELTTPVQREGPEDEPEGLRISFDEKPGQQPAPPRADHDTVTTPDHTTMEVPLAISDSVRIRPKIQLTIPEQQSISFAYIPHRTMSLAERGGTPASVVSLPSPTAKQPAGNPTSRTRLSIVSPISVMEMPRPRRPFSTWSFSPTLQDSRLEKAVVASPEPKSSSSGSSDETADDEASSSYSPRSSMSSFSADGNIKPLGDLRGSVAFSIVSPARAGIFDDIPPTPKMPALKKSMLSLAESVNKPLPPEPSVIEVAPLLPAGRPCSRSTSMHSKLGLFIPKSSPSPINIPSRKSSRISLLSKYSTTDLKALDALDDAFQRSSPPKIFVEDTQQSTPTLSQVEEALEAQLATISEDVPSQSDRVPLVHFPLQIGRGPMQMKPSRAAPPPPPVAEPLSMSRRRDRKKSTLHVAQQVKAIETGNFCRRGSVPIGGHGKWKAKMHNVLAKADPRISTPMEREISSDSNWSFADSKRSLGSVPDLTGDDTSGSEVSSFPDIVVAEVKERLELLSAATDHSESTSSFSGASLTEVDEVRERLQTLNVINDSNIARPDETVPSVDSTVGFPIQQKNTDHTRSISADVSHVGLQARRGRQGDRLVHSMGSLANVDIAELYANMPAYDPNLRESMTAEELKRQISADAAETVLLRILQSLDNLQDLFAAAVISRGFYTTFKRNELPLMKNAVYAMSPAAWELREMSPPYTANCDIDNDAPVPEYTPATYLRHYTRDMYIMVALKSLILVHCESFLRPETISALAGTESARSAEIDEAFWRVWTFCRIFGCGKNREDDIVGQMDWLKGGDLASRQSTTTSLSMTDPFGMNGVLFSPPPSFAKGNRNGLTAEELYDMTEIWTCLGVLVRGFQGKAEQAREYGIFENADIFPGDVDKENKILGSYPLCSSIGTKLTIYAEEWTYHLLTLGPATILDLAGASSPTASTFAQAHSNGWTSWQPPAFGSSKSTFLKEAVSRVYEEKITKQRSSRKATGEPSQAGLASQSRQRCLSHAAEIRARRLCAEYTDLPVSEERPLSKYPEVVRRLEAPPMLSTPPAPQGPQVKDPVDMALERLVAMGFDEGTAKKALAETDSGNAIDFDAAVNNLMRERDSRIRLSGTRHGW